MIDIISLGQADEEAREQCAELYCQIWREPPWDEDFWNPSEVLQDMDKEMRKPGAEGFLAIVDGKVVGFTWGYPVSCEELCEIGGSALGVLYKDCELVFYVDELGVHPEYRRRGLGSVVSEHLIKVARAKKARKVVLRTDQGAYAARALYSKLGFWDLGIRDREHPGRTYLVLD